MNLLPYRKTERLLCVFAHPDDEVFCAGGTLAYAADKGIETMVVSATRGEAGQIRDGRLANRWTLGEVREREFQQSTRHLGVHHVVCLNYGDGTLADVASYQLVKDIVRIIRQFQPDTVITFGPDGAYGHPDHIAIGAATTEAVKLAGNGLHFPELLLDGLIPYTPDRLYYSYFPRQPRLLSDQLAQWLVEFQNRFQGTADFAHSMFLLAEEATMLGYVSDHVETSWFPAGFSIIEQDEPANKLYFILSGKVCVQRQSKGGVRQTVARLRAGQFFGEDGLAHQQPRNAHVVADSDVTCLVFSPESPSNFAGRGAGAQFVDLHTTNSVQPMLSLPANVTCFDVKDYVPQKTAALAAHQTQFSFKPDTLPLSILRDLFGYEYFVHAPLFEKKEYNSLSLGTSLAQSWRQVQPEMAAL